MVKWAFQMMAVFWALSPIIFIVLRLRGIFDYPSDWAIFIGLALISFITMFLCYKTWEE